MNSFEIDMKRAICSKGFLIGVLLEIWALFTSGFNSDIYRALLPVAATFPYTTAWLIDYHSGFIKEYLPRTGRAPYILGKFFSGGLSGGMVVAVPYMIYHGLKENAQEADVVLIFVSGVLWASVAVTLAAVSDSRCIAYGGSFVVCYLLVILHERYFDELYCLYPYEWISPEHTWILDAQGIVFMLLGIILIMLGIYSEVLRRCITRV